MKRTFGITLGVLLAIAAFTLTGCTKEEVKDNEAKAKEEAAKVADKTKELAKDVKDKAGPAMDKMVDSAKDAGTKLKDGAEKLGDKAKEKMNGDKAVEVKTTEVKTPDGTKTEVKTTETPSIPTK